MRWLRPLVAVVFSLGVASPAHAPHRVVEALLPSGAVGPKAGGAPA